MSIYKNFGKCCLSGLLLCGLWTGCGSENGSPRGEQAQSVSATSDGTQTELADGNLEKKLLGVWLGEAVLNEALVEEKLQTLPPERQQLVLNRASSFLSTIMAIEFRADGTMENEIALTPVDGQPLRDGRVGTWKVIEQKADQIVIETAETMADGSVMTSQRLYEVSPDGSQVALRVPMNDELGACQPMILFSRQYLSDSNLAQQPGDVQVK